MQTAQAVFEQFLPAGRNEKAKMIEHLQLNIHTHNTTKQRILKPATSVYGIF